MEKIRIKGYIAVLLIPFIFTIFGCASTLVIREGTTEITRHYRNKGIRSVVIPDTLKRIRSYAFYEERKITSITMPAGFYLDGTVFPHNFGVFYWLFGRQAGTYILEGDEWTLNGMKIRRCFIKGGILSNTGGISFIDGIHSAYFYVFEINEQGATLLLGYFVTPGTHRIQIHSSRMVETGRIIREQVRGIEGNLYWRERPEMMRVRDAPITINYNFDAGKNYRFTGSGISELE